MEMKPLPTDASQDEVVMPIETGPGEPPRPQQPQHSAKVDFTNIIIGWILLGGVALSAMVIFIGVILLLVHPGQVSTQGLHGFPRTFGEIAAGLAALQAQSIIALGLLLLIATPVLRVAVSIVAFAIEHDRRYVVITIIVLAILLFSIFGVGSLVAGTASGAPTSARFNVLILALIFVASMVAGLLGSLVGLGGGVLIVPLLTLAFGMPIALAIGASIISVIATSSGAAAAYVRDHMTNLRVGMVLEIATTTGAITGAFLAGLLAPSLLFIIFGFILLVSAAPLVFRLGEELPQGVKNDRWAEWLKLASSYPDHRLGRTIKYEVSHTPLGAGMMYVAGLVSGLLGIGSGTFKVIAMDTLMRLPMKVSTTTSNFMIGVTAAASAGIYFSRGDIPPMVAAPVALGILVGALVGARLLARMSNRGIRLIFIPVIVLVAIQMILRGFGVPF